MFSQPRNSNRRRRAALAVSFSVHAMLIYTLVRPPRPTFVTPSQVAYGHGGVGNELVYLARTGAPAGHSIAAQARRPATLPRALPRRTAATPPAPEKRDSVSAIADAARAGSPYGSLLQGPVTGHDVRPALPIEFPKPAVFPWQIPAGVEGNVVVEITIDAQGLVTDTRVLQGLGHGIEEKCVAALRSWRFRPAMMDGRPIPSQQDVYFHFPS